MMNGFKMDQSIMLLEKEYNSLMYCLNSDDWCSELDNDFHIRTRKQYTELSNDYLKALTILKYENRR